MRFLYFIFIFRRQIGLYPQYPAPSFNRKDDIDNEKKDDDSNDNSKDNDDDDDEGPPPIETNQFTPGFYPGTIHIL